MKSYKLESDETCGVKMPYFAFFSSGQGKLLRSYKLKVNEILSRKVGDI